MSRSRKATGNCVVAAVAAAAFLAGSLIMTGSTHAVAQAAQKPAQDVLKAEPPKIQIITQQKVETKEVVKVQTKQVEKAEAKEAAPAVQKAVKNARVVMQAPRAQPEIEPDPALTRQFIQQFRPILCSELRLLTSTCDPTPAQRREIAIEGGKALKDAAAKMSAAQQGMNMGRGVNGIPDPRQIIHEAMDRVSQEKLTADQLARYKNELEEKHKDAKAAVTLNIVSNLDKLMVLSKDQRDKIAQAILANWDDRTFPTLDTVTVYENYFPIIPNQVFSPILNDEQMRLWKTAPKIQFGSVRNFGFMNNQGVVQADDDDDPDVKAALGGEEKPK